MSLDLNTGSQLLSGLNFPVLKIQDFSNGPETSEDWNVASNGDDYFLITFVDADENNATNNSVAAGSIDSYSSPPAPNDEEVVVNDDNQAQGFNIPATPDSVHVPQMENADATSSGVDACKMNGCEDYSKIWESHEVGMSLDKSGSNFPSTDFKKTLENYLPMNTPNMMMNLSDLKTTASFGSLDLEMNSHSFPKSSASVAMDLSSSDKSVAATSLSIGMATICGPEPETTVPTAGSVDEMVAKPNADIQFELTDEAVSQSNPSSSYSEIGESSARKVGSSTRGKKSKVSVESKRRTKQRIPDKMKDEKYWAMRKRNTESARKCRENKKLRQSQSKIDQLLHDNDQLLKEVMANRKSIEDFKEKMLSLGIDLQLL